MRFFSLNIHTENNIIRLGIIIFWWLFWLFNVVDKFIVSEGVMWVGKNRAEQFMDYFSSIGIEGTTVPYLTLSFVTALEVVALIFTTLALWYFFKGKKDKARAGLFWGILTSLFIFSFFAIGDQIFGDRVELLEHSIYWIGLVISWFIYTHADLGHKEGFK